jgi:hypothetical protein
VTIEDVADYCEFKDCAISLGSEEAGFIDVDGGGYRRRYNYDRFLSLNELSALPSPRQVMQKAASFTVKRAAVTVVLSREEFERELRRFRAQVGA